MSFLLALAACRSEPDGQLVALAASSLTEVLPEVARRWEAQGGRPVLFSFDASSRLAKQVEAGAPVDLVFFADAPTLDALEGLITEGTRRNVAGNELVVVVPAASDWTPAGPADLAQVQHLALAGENVPAGRYGRAALAATGAWPAVEGKVVSGDNVRTTLAWVARGEADAGIVYATDARAEVAVKVAFTFAPATHEPIVYPAAVVKASAHQASAAEFLAFLGSEPAREVLRAHGFAPPP